MRSNFQATKSQSGCPTVVIEGSTARVCLNRATSHNRLELGDIERLIEICDELNSNPEVQAVVFQSSGLTFSSGFDLRVLGQNAKRDVRRFEHLNDCIEGLNAVTIARLHAPVVGGSTDLVLACDFRIAIQGIYARMPAVLLGIHYYPHGMRRWIARLGDSTCRKMFLLGEDISDEELLRTGYIDELVEPGQLDARIAELLGRISAGAPHVRHSMKKTLNELSRGEYLAQELYDRLDQSLEGAELAEALNAFNAKRKPVYRA